jgi:hypothetical protein
LSRKHHVQERAGRQFHGPTTVPSSPDRFESLYARSYRRSAQMIVTRFTSILRQFGFPKLESPEPPYLDANFVPHVRGNVYREIGSSGALTLIALAWQLSVFERAFELGHPHPWLSNDRQPAEEPCSRRYGRAR